MQGSSGAEDGRKEAGGEPPLTVLLARARAGDRTATEEIFPLVYDELRQLAERHLAGERAPLTLQATALVHEAYLRLSGPADAGWESRAHFFGAAARAIRRILIDRARAQARDKRGAGERPIPLDTSIDVAIEAPEVDVDVLALDEALTELGRVDPVKAQLVELRFFGGLSVAEAAAAQGVSVATAERSWQFARAWLHKRLTPGDRDRSAT